MFMLFLVLKNTCYGILSMTRDKSKALVLFPSSDVQRHHLFLAVAKALRLSTNASPRRLIFHVTNASTPKVSCFHNQNRGLRQVGLHFTLSAAPKVLCFAIKADVIVKWDVLNRGIADEFSALL